MKNIISLLFYNVLFFSSIWVAMAFAHDTNDDQNRGENTTAHTEINKNLQNRSTKNEIMNFTSINRLQYKHSFNGESAFVQGAFIILPHGITVAELFQTFTEKEEDGGDEFENFNLEIKLARYLVPSNDWGRALSVVGRFQAVNNISSVYSVGLQWNISETPGIKFLTPTVSWKSILQLFIKEKTDYSDEKEGTLDLFHWYQFPLIGSKLYVRGVNTYYYLPNQENSYYLMQDLILTVISRKLDIFLRHEYQNLNFLEHGKGSQIALGVRIAH